MAGVCLNHKSVLCWKVWRDRAVLVWMLPSTYSTLCCKKIQVSTNGTSLWNFVLILDLENFAIARRSSKRVINLARQRWTLTAWYTARHRSSKAVFTADKLNWTPILNTRIAMKMFTLEVGELKDRPAPSWPSYTTRYLSRSSPSPNRLAAMCELQFSSVLFVCFERDLSWQYLRRSTVNLPQLSVARRLRADSSVTANTCVVSYARLELSKLLERYFLYCLRVAYIGLTCIVLSSLFA